MARTVNEESSAGRLEGVLTGTAANVVPDLAWSVDPVKWSVDWKSNCVSVDAARTIATKSDEDFTLGYIQTTPIIPDAVHVW